MKPVDWTSSNGAAVIRCFTGEALLPDPAARERLEQLAHVPGVVGPVVVLPDVHVKSRNLTPTGTVVATRDVLIPRAIDDGIGCGMAMVSTPVPARDLTERHVDELFGRLREEVPVKSHESARVSEHDLVALLGHGLAAPGDPLGLGDKYRSRVENGGVLPGGLAADELIDAIPRRAVRKGVHSVGTLGAGNHFVELQEIVEVIDRDAAARLGLAAGAAFFMIHTDSRRVGKKIMGPLAEEAARSVAPNGESLWTLPLDSKLGRRYLQAVVTGCHAAFVNRAVIIQTLRRCVADVLGDRSVELPLVYDCSHESIQPETHGAARVWVHRHGASRALPGGACTSDEVLSRIGQPVPVPGSMGTDSFVATVSAGAAGTFHSVAHGAGRVIEKSDACSRFDAADVASWMSGRGIRLYRYGTDDIAGQMPAAFKDPAAVVTAMANLDLIRPVVRLRPLAVLKG